MMRLFRKKEWETIWEDRHSRLWSFYCPLCRAERALPFKPQPWQPKYVTRVAAAAAMFTLVSWPIFHWKGVISFVPFWLLFETFYRARSRALLTCRQCGFDPFLALVDARKAKSEIELHWRRKFEERGIPYPEKPTHPAGRRPDPPTDKPGKPAP